MKNSEIIEILDNIRFYISAEQYNDAIELIEKSKSKLKLERNMESEYIEDLIINLK